MDRRLSMATLTMLMGVLWALPALAAAPAIVGPKYTPMPAMMLGRNHVANLNLGGLVAPVLPQGAFGLGATTIANAGSSLSFDLSRSRNWDPSAELFPSAASLNATYLAGTTTFVAANFALGDLDFNLGYTSLGVGALSQTQPSDFARDLAERLGADVRSIGTTTARLNWNFSDWGGVSILASRSNSNVSLLGGVPETLRTGSTSESSALGISARVGFGEGWVTTLTYAEGITQLDPSRDGVLGLGLADAVRSEAYGIGLAKTGLFGQDALGIALSRPLQINGGNLAGLNTDFALANAHARESDVELGYVTTFLNGTLALQANAAYQLNAAGAKGQNAVAGVARAKLNF